MGPIVLCNCVSKLKIQTFKTFQCAEYTSLFVSSYRIDTIGYHKLRDKGYHEKQRGYFIPQEYWLSEDIGMLWCMVVS